MSEQCILFLSRLTGWQVWWIKGKNFHMLPPEHYQQLILTKTVIIEAGPQQRACRGSHEDHCMWRCFHHCSHGELMPCPSRTSEAWGYRHTWGTSQEWLPGGHPMWTFMLRSNGNIGNLIKCWQRTKTWQHLRIFEEIRSMVMNKDISIHLLRVPIHWAPTTYNVLSGNTRK